MNTLPVKVEPRAIDVSITGDSIRVILADGRELTVPLEWFPRLRKATSAQRKKWRLVGKGIGIHWEDIDEDISIESLLTTDNHSFVTQNRLTSRSPTLRQKDGGHKKSERRRVSSRSTTAGLNKQADPVKERRGKLFGR